MHLALPKILQRTVTKDSASSIEPLIDIFFSPTGYTFQKGDIYVSGFSLAAAEKFSRHRQRARTGWSQW